MQAKCLVTLTPFPVPESVTLAPKVRKTEAAPPVPGVPYVSTPRGYWEIPLADLDSDTLHRLCEEFRDTVFFKANRAQPPEAALPEIDKAPLEKAISALRSVLCDPVGDVRLGGSSEDDAIVWDALEALDRFRLSL